MTTPFTVAARINELAAKGKCEGISAVLIPTPKQNGGDLLPGKYENDTVVILHEWSMNGNDTAAACWGLWKWLIQRDPQTQLCPHTARNWRCCAPGAYGTTGDTLNVRDAPESDLLAACEAECERLEKA